MKMQWLEQIKCLQKNKRGSSTITLAMAFLAFSCCIVVAIGIVRQMVVGSECRIFGRVWTKAILSEYDKYLLDDYGIMAFQGNEIEVKKRVNRYLDYSCKGKLDAKIENSSASLYGYEISDPKRFSESIEAGLAISITEGIISEDRQEHNNVSSDYPGQEGGFGKRKIGNEVVINTLPSSGADLGFDIDDTIDAFKDEDILDSLTSSAGDTAVELTYLKAYYSNFLTAGNSKETYFRNEWEYIVCGEFDDYENYKGCKNRIILIRNGLNFFSLYKDPVKISEIQAIAAIITPGPLATATQVLIAEAWALAEAYKDVEVLYEGGRVPLIKTPESWQTDLESILKSEAVQGNLDEEAKKLWKENENEIKEITDKDRNNPIDILKGQSYEDYLLLMIIASNEDVRLLRMMDIVHINMKYRYYEDFNFDEYYCGLDLGLKVNGRNYEISDEYK